MKIALVTGASGDIGSSIAERLAENGWSLYLHYFSNQEKVQAQVRSFQQRFPKQEFYPVQVNLEAAGAVEQLKKQTFALNAIVFSHGITEYGLLQEITPEKMDQLWEMHVKNPILITQAFQDKIHQYGDGRIVFISSIYGEMGSSNEVFYSTVKGAQLAFVRAYSKEVASLGMTVNAVNPGAIQTHMNQHYTETDLEALRNDIPIGRLGTPEEISFWVAHMLNPESRYMTGQALTVSGGWLK